MERKDKTLSKKAANDRYEQIKKYVAQNAVMNTYLEKLLNKYGDRFTGYAGSSSQNIFDNGSDTKAFGPGSFAFTTEWLVSTKPLSMPFTLTLTVTSVNLNGTAGQIGIYLVSSAQVGVQALPFTNSVTPSGNAFPNPAWSASNSDDVYSIIFSNTGNLIQTGRSFGTTNPMSQLAALSNGYSLAAGLKFNIIAPSASTVALGFDTANFNIPYTDLANFGTLPVAIMISYASPMTFTLSGVLS